MLLIVFACLQEFDPFDVDDEEENDADYGDKDKGVDEMSEKELEALLVKKTTELEKLKMENPVVNAMKVCEFLLLVACAICLTVYCIAGFC